MGPRAFVKFLQGRAVAVLLIGLVVTFLGVWGVGNSPNLLVSMVGGMLCVVGIILAATGLVLSTEPDGSKRPPSHP